MNQNQQKKYAPKYTGGGLKKGEVNELRLKVQEQAEAISVLNHMVEQEAARKRDAEYQYDELQMRVDVYNNASFIDKLFYVFSGNKI